MEIYTTSVQFISPDNFGVRVAVFYNSRALFSAEGKQLAIVGWCSLTKNIFVQNSSQSWWVKAIVSLITEKKMCFLFKTSISDKQGM